MIGRIWELADRAPLQLTFNALGHSVLAGRHTAAIASALASWRCHVCGTRLPGLLEFDGHGADGECRPICQFCHNLDHPMWAATTGRLTLVLAPDVPQAELTGLCWTILALGQLCPDGFRDYLAPDDDPPRDVPVAWRKSLNRAAPGADALREALENRRAEFVARFGAMSAEAFLEGIITHRRRIADDVRRELAAVRFVPSVVIEGYERIDVPGRLSVWTGSGFEDRSREIGSAWLRGLGAVA